MKTQPIFTYIGGPTALIEWAGVRFLTDPTFDPAGSQSTNGPVTLKKLENPALSPEELGKVDVVLLSHDHHYDNLDHAGRTLLSSAQRVLTTREGSERLGGNAIGLDIWQSVHISAPSGLTFTVTATPCRHGPAGLDRGPVCGFVVSHSEGEDSNLYVSGDTVWYHGVAEVAERFDIGIAMLFMGAARVPVVADAPLTMTASDGIKAARAFPHATIVPLHYEGWAHFSESREVIAEAFAHAGLAQRLLWLPRGKITAVQTSSAEQFSAPYNGTTWRL
jgi:L-ascorbate metabolism protein UlaG (beta-lactamase superfamily)